MKQCPVEIPSIPYFQPVNVLKNERHITELRRGTRALKLHIIFFLLFALWLCPDILSEVVNHLN